MADLLWQSTRVSFVTFKQGRALYGTIPVKTETFRELWAPLVHTSFGGNSYGPIIGPHLVLGKYIYIYIYIWTNGLQKFPPTLVLVHGWLFPVKIRRRGLSGAEPDHSKAVRCSPATCRPRLFPFIPEILGHVLETNLASRWEGVRLPRAWISQKFPQLPRNFSGDFPGSSLTVELNSNPEVPRKFPKLPRKFPDFPGGQPLSLGPDTLSWLTKTFSETSL